MAISYVTRAVAGAVSESPSERFNNEFPGRDDSLTLHYDFAKQPDLRAYNGVGPTLGITRTTTRTVYDQDNIIRTVRAGEAAFTGARRVENLILRSEEFDSGSWTDRLAITANDTTDPFGNTAADRLEGNGLTSPRTRQGFTVKVGEQYTWSVYAKQGTIKYIHMDDDTNGEDTAFDLNAGVVDVSDGDSTIIEALGDGWFRCSVTFTAIGTSITPAIYVTVAKNRGTALASGSYLYAFGAQLENVSGQLDPSPSEYQATTTTAVALNYATKRRTNLLLQSNDLSTTWTNSRTTDLQNVGTDPFGGNTANSINENNATANTHQMQQAITLPSAGQYTFSVYLKASNRTWAGLRPTSFGSGSGVSYFDLGNGVVGTVGSSTDSHSIEDAGNGWYRCTIVFTEDGSDLVGVFNVYAAEADSDILYDGLTQESILFYGAQLEKSPSATPYVPTTTAVASSGFDTTITPTGISVWEARTNICLRSEDLSTTWTNLRSVDTQNVGTAPDGTNTANDLVDDGSTGSNSINIAQALTFSTSTVYTMSGYFKADQLAFVYMSIQSMGSLQLFATFNLTTGTVLTVGSNITTSSIEDVGNGWFRGALTFTSDAADTTGDLKIFAAVADNNITVPLDGTSSIWIWGMQMEAGYFPTSYIPTVASSVTRSRDEVLSSDVTWLNTAAGTLYSEASQSGHLAASGSQYVFEVSDSGESDRVLHFVNSTNQDAQHRINKAGATQLSLTANGVYANEALVRMATGWQLNDGAAYTNGSQIGTDSSLALPVGMDRFAIGSNEAGSGAQLNGHIVEIRYYNVRKDNQFLEALSNGDIDV